MPGSSGKAAAYAAMRRSWPQQHPPPGAQAPLLLAAAAGGAGPHWNSPKCRERSPMTSKCLPSQLSPTMAATPRQGKRIEGPGEELGKQVNALV